MKDIVIYKPKKGEIVEVEVVRVTPREVTVDLKTMTEGTIFIEHFGTDKPSLIGLVKVGDKIKAQVTKVSEGDESSVILLSRLPLVKEEQAKILQKDFDDNKTIKTIVTKVGEKGLHLKYLVFELFLPYSLLDNELKEQKESLANKPLEIIIEELVLTPRFKAIATRKPIYEKQRAEIRAKKHEDRQNEIDSINKNDILTGTVEKIDKSAAIIKFNHVMGLLRISQLSHHRIEDINTILKLGQKVEVKVISKEGIKIDLSMKALQDSPFEIFTKENKKGSKVTGTITQKLPYGVIIELAPKVTGLLHKSEYSWNPKDNFDAYLKIGDQIEVQILNVDKKAQKIQLSKKTLEHNPWDKLKIKRNDIIEVLVTEVTKDGLKIAYDGVDGFIPAKETSKDNLNVESTFTPNQTVKAKVIDFNKTSWILVLSIKTIEIEEERKEFKKFLEENQDEEAKVTLGDVFEIKK